MKLKYCYALPKRYVEEFDLINVQRNLEMIGVENYDAENLLLEVMEWLSGEEIILQIKKKNSNFMTFDIIGALNLQNLIYQLPTLLNQWDIFQKFTKILIYQLLMKSMQEGFQL